MIDPPRVRRATASDRASVVRTLVRAFDTDPVANYLLRSDAKRAQAFETFFDFSFVSLTLPFGETWTTEDGQGVALWTPPNRWSTFSGLLHGYRLLGAVGLGRAFNVVGKVNRVNAKHPRAPHYYLFAVGVDPAAQGRGLGSALLRSALARIDAEGASAYLEASTPLNARLYARHGFRVTEEFRMADDAPTVSLMWRDPLPTESARG